MCEMDGGFDRRSEMPRFDGTGPRGDGPMTGRGEGYCAIVLSSSKRGGKAYGYAGLQGTPVRQVSGARFLSPGGRPVQATWRSPWATPLHRPWRGAPWRRSRNRF
ncbi:MAG: DUF5320 domain-containing protein [Chloroflexota bacterium]|nr:DUF5320 domain-containing protein [Chloroflexota bacterium]